MTDQDIIEPSDARGMNLSIEISEAQRFADRDNQQYLSNSKGFSVGNREYRNLGSIFTPPEVADYLTNWAVRSGQTKVLDLGVGDGVFVWSAYKRLLALKTPSGVAATQVYGTEIFEPAYKNFIHGASHQNLLFPNIIHGDFLNTEFPEVDAVVGNPPYVRRHYLKNIEHIRRSIIEKLPEVEADLSRMADLYIYFLLRAAVFLREGGRMAVIVADTWLGVNYGQAFRRYLTENFEINRLISFDRRIFNADVKPVLLLATKRKMNKMGQSVDFLRVRNGLPIQFLSQSTKQLEAHKDISVSKVRQDTLDAKQIWHRHFGDADVIRTLSSHELMVDLSKLATTRIGIQTLAKEFFVLTPEAARRHGIEIEHLRPMVHSIKTVDQLIVEIDSQPFYYLFSCDKSKEELTDTNTLRYILSGETTPVKIRGKNQVVTGYHQKERIQKDLRVHWYDLERDIQRRGIATILIPRLIYKNLTPVWNKAKYVPGELFIEFLLPQDSYEDTEVYLAVLSSSISEIIIRSRAQVYGGGTYNISPGLLKKAPFLDVRQLSKEHKRQLRIAYNCYLLDPERHRMDIDTIVYQVMNIDDSLKLRIELLLQDMRAGKEKKKYSYSNGNVSKLSGVREQPNGEKFSS